MEDLSIKIRTTKWEIFIHNYHEFFKKIKFKAFAPFKTTQHALKNFMFLSQNLVSTFLSDFLQTQIKCDPQTFPLGVEDSKLANQIYEKNKIKTVHNDSVLELIRGIRFHLEKFIQKLIQFSLKKSLCGLGFLFSRSKMNLCVRKTDNMIIQSVSLVELIEKDINFFTMTLKEWYSKHFPELAVITTNSYLYSIAVKFIGNRKKLTMNKTERLNLLLINENEAENIFDAARTSIGSPITIFDLSLIEKLSTKIILLTEFKNRLTSYLNQKIRFIVPNLAILLGENLTAKLIAKAGSLKNLVKSPSSTIQLLGAEKALFRALKQKSKTPKFGILFNSSFVLKTSVKNKGKISRFLANKCSLAVKIDYFSLSTTNLYGKKLREQLKSILQFWET